MNNTFTNTFTKKIVVVGMALVLFLMLFLPSVNSQIKIIISHNFAKISSPESEVMIPDWRNVIYEPFNVSVPSGVTNPVLTASDVTDKTASFVADPFIFYEDGKWYMFFEVEDYVSADIGLATSNDGLNWTYDQIVLDTDFHKSYPLVFKWNNMYYMIPECVPDYVKLYMTNESEFPYNWTFVDDLLSGRNFADPSIFRYNDTWWMFVGNAGSSICWLYYSDNLTDPSSWTEHPSSPIITDSSKARPSGRPIIFDNDRIIRFAQKCNVSYGQKVRAFEVDILNKTSYAEHEIIESPILEESGSGWNSTGMHHIDPWWVGDRWLAAVDGNGVYNWCIGIYTTESIGPFIPDWSNVIYEPFNFGVPDGVSNPILTASNVTDITASYVYTPFVFQENDIWYMFFAAHNGTQAQIGLAISNNALDWTYDKIVLDESFHISSPLVFKWNNTYYMAPECTPDYVKLYMTNESEFPYNWTFVDDLLSGRNFADPSIFRYNDTWWMFVGNAGSSICWLYYSDNLTDPSSWTEHPSSPISSSNNDAKPAGRNIVFDGDRVIRWGMDCNPVFGQKVRAFEVDILNKTSYAEHEINESPILEESGSGWNSTGMHHIDPWWVGDRWLAAVDANGVYSWCIGIYATPYVINQAPILSSELPSNGAAGVPIGNVMLSINAADPDGDLMNITFRTNASGSWQDVGINNSVSGGVYQQIYSFNDSGTAYWWSVNASVLGSGNWTNETYSFTTKFEVIPGIWWNADWPYRKEITIDHNKVEANSNHVNFPVLINITDSDLVSKAQSNGDDLIFANYSGIKLHHEIELYKGSSGRLVAWVNVTSLSSTTDTILYMYYGNQSCGNQENISGVWDSNFKLVQHLNETSGVHYDSTVFGNDGTPQNGVNQTAVGKIDGADEFDAIDDSVVISNSGSLDIVNVTIEAWFNPYNAESGGNWQGVVSKRTSAWTITIDPYNYWPPRLKMYIGNKNIPSGAEAEVSFNEWYHAALLINGNTARLYLDGQNVVTDTSVTVGSTASDLYIGRNQWSANDLFNGTIDEVRISNIARDNSWIKTCYNTMNSPSTFYSVGSEEKLDAVLPEIKDITATPDSQEVGGYVNITCDVTDNVGVNVVKVNITYPDNSQVNVTMSGGKYYYNTTYDQMGSYSYFIWANDTNGNVNTSTVYHFDIKKLYKISLSTSWNLISLPFNESIDKTDIIVRNNSIDYNWTEAVNEGIVLNYLYKWDGTTYTPNETFEPGFGYWMWAYYSCELIFSSNAPDDDYLTTIQQEWNIIGLPYNQTLAKEDIIVHYDGVDYTWYQAVQSNIILGFIYSWNRTAQMYMLSDVFDPGQGYWMYAYYECILEK